MGRTRQPPTIRRRLAEHARRRPITSAAAVAAAAALAALVVLPLGDDPPAPLEVSMSEYAFDPDVITLAPGQRLRITNDGALPHSFFVPELAKGVELQPGQEATLELPSDATGQHAVICDLPGHQEAGMVAALVIR